MQYMTYGLAQRSVTALTIVLYVQAVAVPGCIMSAKYHIFNITMIFLFYYLIYDHSFLIVFMRARDSGFTNNSNRIYSNLSCLL